MEPGVPAAPAADRMALALRRNRGRQLCPGFREAAARALGREADTLRLTSLEEHDRARAAFAEARGRTARECGEPGRFCLDTTRREELDRAVAELRRRFPAGEMLLFREGSELCGAVAASADELLERLDALVELDGEDLLACTADASAGLFCAWWEEVNSPGREQPFQLLAWYPPETEG
jgi:hypothetical protein